MAYSLEADIDASDDDVFSADYRHTGPSTADECMTFGAFGWAALKFNGLFHFKVDLSVKLRLMLEQGLGLSTEYSGYGSPEEALREIILYADSDVVPRVYCERSGDVQQVCRRVVAAHVSEPAVCPRCIFGDITARTSPSRAAKLQKLAKHARTQARIGIQLARNKTRKRAVVVKAGRWLMHHAMDVMLQDLGEDRAATAWCYNHERECRFARTARDVEHNGTRGLVHTKNKKQNTNKRRCSTREL